MDGVVLVVVATEAEAPEIEGVEVLVCGVGKVAAATETALRLARGGVSAVVSFGVAGAYPGTGLAVGDVVLATQVAVLDEGLETGSEFVPFARPGMAVPGAAWVATDPVLRSALASGGGAFAVVQAPVGTVSVCAGTARLARERAATGAIAEAMEGAAIAHAAGRYGLPFAEVRGISNLAGPREGAAFELAGAVANATLVLRGAVGVKLRIGLSPCPNDTFIFHGLLHGLVDTGDVSFEPVMADVEELNERMIAGELPVTKASFAAFAQARERYAALRTGGALGRGNGPLIVSREPLDPGGLAGRRVLLPGALTTAALLFRTFHPDVSNTRALRYDELLGALTRGEADAAVIIHELRFTYAEHGLRRVEDLGQRFETATGLPVPLGGVFVRRDMDPKLSRDIERWVGQSLAYARAHPAASRDFVREHAQELAAGVTAAHIDLYVNEFSDGYGPEGERAIARLLEMASAAGAAPGSATPLFV